MMCSSLEYRIKGPKLGMFPLIQTVLNGGYNMGNYIPLLRAVIPKPQTFKSPFRTVSRRGSIPTLNPCCHIAGPFKQQGWLEFVGPLSCIDLHGGGESVQGLGFRV